jgi:hypothetical protein
VNKFGGLFVAGIFLSATSFAQPPQSFWLRILVPPIERETPDAVVPFTFRLEPNLKASLKQMADANAVAAPAGSSQACKDRVGSAAQQVGIQVDATVMPKGDGSSDVTVRITKRSWQGCRVVNGTDIPVFANRTIESTLTLKDGETRQVPKADIEVTLKAVTP